VRGAEISLKSGDTTQPWHDFTNIKAKPFSLRMDLKFRAGAPHQMPMKLSAQRRNWAAKL
jgi:hypothetical protein